MQESITQVVEAGRAKQSAMKQPRNESQLESSTTPAGRTEGRGGLLAANKGLGSHGKR